MNSEIKVFKNKHFLAEATKIDLFDAVKEGVSLNRDFNIALSGGSTPRTIYEQWATINNDSFWNRVHFFWGDERCVPMYHEESNYKMVKNALLSKIHISPNRIHWIEGKNDPHEEIWRYGEELKANLPAAQNGFPQFDWILLGVGMDGHTASLFPNSPELENKQSICIVAQHPDTGKKRISLSLPVINSARKITFLVTGKEKASIVREILKSETGLNFPAARVRPLYGILQWYLDEDAASEIEA